jgi:D-beta-D-heptose 7-phosphate kinase / D-beta-D-heptose 1-phosphate adenosyltransferase
VLVTGGDGPRVQPFAPTAITRVPADCVDAYIRENGVEWYASWFIGEAPDMGFRGVFSAGSDAAVRAALRGIARTETASRIVTGSERLGRLVQTLRRRRARIVFTNGVFDLLHVGHLMLLEQARALGDALIVAINSDDSTRAFKGAGRPVIPQFARAQVLASLRPVDACFIFPESDPLKVLRAVRPDVLVKGSEYSPGRIVGARFVKGYGGEVVRLSMVKGWSTTSLLRDIRTLSSDLDGRRRTPLP